ncbi:ribonuclease H-like domain-containing protein [Tanacetum coccineum]
MAPPPVHYDYAIVGTSNCGCLSQSGKADDGSLEMDRNIETRLKEGALRQVYKQDRGGEGLLKDRFKGNKFDWKGKQEWTIDYIKRLKAALDCLKKEKEANMALEKDRESLRKELREANRANEYKPDPFSLLQEDILLDIMSRIECTTKELIRTTSTISKRWRNLWASVPHLIFHELEDDVDTQFDYGFGILGRRRNSPNDDELFSTLLVLLRHHYLPVEDITEALVRNSRVGRLLWLLAALTLLKSVKEFVFSGYNSHHEIDTDGDYIDCEFSSSLFQLLLKGAQLSGSGGLGNGSKPGYYQPSTRERIRISGITKALCLTVKDSNAVKSKEERWNVKMIRNGNHKD